MEYPRIQCVRCGYQERFYRGLEQCPRCGGDWLDVIYDYGRVAQVWREELPRRANTMWRYRELLPLRNDANRISLGEGGTPLSRVTNLSLMLGTPHLYIKDERQGTSRFLQRSPGLSGHLCNERTGGHRGSSG
ncbi:MAG: hypothetical protein RMK65_09790, partial [Anaerolineae bacterium]|nr:hypothetical protein [Anaerolineae bacterium]